MNGRVKFLTEGDSTGSSLAFRQHADVYDRDQRRFLIKKSIAMIHQTI